MIFTLKTRDTSSIFICLSLIVSAVSEPQAGVRQVIPDGGGAGPASHKINSGLWCSQASRVGGKEGEHMSDTS